MNPLPRNNENGGAQYNNRRGGGFVQNNTGFPQQQQQRMPNAHLASIPPRTHSAPPTQQGLDQHLHQQRFIPTKYPGVMPYPGPPVYRQYHPVYYPPTQPIMVHGNMQRMPNTAPTRTPTYTAPQRKSKAIKIVDPRTKEEKVFKQKATITKPPTTPAPVLIKPPSTSKPVVISNKDGQIVDFKKTTVSPVNKSENNVKNTEQSHEQQSKLEKERLEQELLKEKLEKERKEQEQKEKEQKEKEQKEKEQSEREQRNEQEKENVEQDKQHTSPPQNNAKLEGANDKGDNESEEDEDEDDEEDDWELKDDTQLTDIEGNKDKSADDNPSFGFSSLSTDGKLVYDRDYLLGFRNLEACKVKPASFPENLDAIIGSTNSSRNNLSNSSRRGSQNKLRNSNRRGRGRGRGRGRSNHGPPGLGGSANNQPRLIPGKDAWQRPKNLEKEEELVRKAKGLLNKITVEKFNRISSRLETLACENDDLQPEALGDLVFEKAILEPKFAKMYANLACFLVNHKWSKGRTFIKAILNKCQEEFEKQVDKSAWDSLSEEEKFERDFSARKRMTGNVKFIGELYLQAALSSKIMHQCIKLLLNKDSADGVPEPEKLETLCKLLTTIGKLLDKECKPEMDLYFNELSAVAANTTMEARLRFMVQDLLDLRRYNWVPRRAETGPKTIKAVHEDAILAQSKSQRRTTKRPFTGSKQIHAAKPTKSKAQKKSSDGWNLVSSGSRKGSSKIKGDSKPSLKPRNVFSGNGAIGWNSNGKSNSERPKKSNMFNALDSNNEEEEEEEEEVEEEEEEEEEEEKTVEQLQRETQSLLQEYFSSRELEEAVLCVQELENGDSFKPQFIATIIGYYFENKVSQENNKLISTLIMELHKNKVLSAEHINNGLQISAETALADLVFDMPALPKDLGWIVATWIEAKILDLGAIYKIFAPFAQTIPMNTVEKLFAYILQYFSEEVALNLYVTSGINFFVLFTERNRNDTYLKRFLERYELEFLFARIFVEQNFDNLLKERASCDVIMAKLQEQLKPEQLKEESYLAMLLGKLFAFVCQAPKQCFEEELAQYCAPVFKELIGGDLDLQYFLIFEAIKYWASTDYQSGLLLKLLKYFHASSLVSDTDVLAAWPAKFTHSQEMKSKALAETSSWLEQLYL